MKKIYAFAVVSALLSLVTVAMGCAKKVPVLAASANPPSHEHHAPHGGTPVVLGTEAYHVELVRDASTGVLQAYLFDGELENFIRSSAPSFDVVATANGLSQTLTLKAVANTATGETVGDTSLFETQADWLKTTNHFDGVLKSITIRGSTFNDVPFDFPKGNDKE
jgi:hypothetical protein